MVKFTCIMPVTVPPLIKFTLLGRSVVVVVWLLLLHLSSAWPFFSSMSCPLLTIVPPLSCGSVRLIFFFCMRLLHHGTRQDRAFSSTWSCSSSQLHLVSSLCMLTSQQEGLSKKNSSKCICRFYVWNNKHVKQQMMSNPEPEFHHCAFKHHWSEPMSKSNPPKGMLSSSSCSKGPPPPYLGIYPTYYYILPPTYILPTTKPTA